MTANVLDPLDQFETMTTDQKIAKLHAICVAQQLAINGLDIRHDRLLASLTRLRETLDEVQGALRAALKALEL